MQKEAVEEIERNKPKYIVYISRRTSYSMEPETSTYIFSQIDRIIKRDYYLDGLVIIKKDKSVEYLLGYETIDKYRNYMRENISIILYRRK